MILDQALQWIEFNHYDDMNISFSNTDLMQRCNREKEMLSAYGTACANLLKMRLLQLLAAECLGVFSPPGAPPLRCMSDTKKQMKRFKFPLKNCYILIFEAVDGEISDDKCNLNWHTIKTIVILNIEKITHD